MPRYAARKDENHATIVKALRQVGASVVVIDQRGVPDLLVGWAGHTYLLEVKRPPGPRGGMKDRHLLDTQVEFFRTWRGKPPVVVDTVDAALAAIGLRVVNRSATDSVQVVRATRTVPSV